MIIKSILEFIGQCVINLIFSIKYLLEGKVNWKNTIIQAASIGYDSVGISLIIIFVTGAVISLQLARYFYMSGGEAYVGGLVSITLVRELAPVFTALAISARAGTAIASEIGNMKISQQVDAMKVLSVNPLAYLVLPRVIAAAVMVPLVTILAQLTGLIGGMFIAKLSINLHPQRFFNAVWLYTQTKDVYICLLKAFVFGIIMALVCSTQGLNTTGGAANVGKAVTKSAIWTTVIILIADYIISWIYY
ncbi:MAG: ABC transporter permease [Candidatus Gastranaerophilales bacterium]|nr:ABC transporter permease [Candidatus Gastranaerophilales bacterium]